MLMPCEKYSVRGSRIIAAVHIMNALNTMQFVNSVAQEDPDAKLSDLVPDMDLFHLSAPTLLPTDAAATNIAALSHWMQLAQGQGLHVPAGFMYAELCDDKDGCVSLQWISLTCQELNTMPPQLFQGVPVCCC